MHDDAEAQHSGSRRRRRARRAARHQQDKGLTYLQGRRFGRQIFALMAVVTLVYGGVVLLKVCGAGGVLGGVRLGMSQQDVRYRLGPPLVDPQLPGAWLYARGGSRLQLIFGGDQRVSEAICSEGEAAEQPCANILGVMVNTSEAALKLRLGPPDRENYLHGDKLIAYDRLGSVFRLRQSVIVEIDQRGSGSFLGRVLETLWIMLP